MKLQICFISKEREPHTLKDHTSGKTKVSGKRHAQLVQGFLFVIFRVPQQAQLVFRKTGLRFFKRACFVQF